jgi:GT2 family glycosyltransferase
MNEIFPDLSIIISSYNARKTISCCIESLRRQRTTRHFEVIVVDSSNDDTAQLVRDHYPNVRLITSPIRIYCGDARNIGMSVIRSDLIAFLDADCYVDENWVDVVFQAHRSEALLVGGIIDNIPHLGLVSWAYYFCEFSLWLPARSHRHIREMAGCCLSFKKAAYEQYGPFIEGTYCSDTAFQWRLQKDGHNVLFDPVIRVYHHSPSRLGLFLSHVYEHRKHFARVKCQEKRLSVIRRFLEITILPITPMLLMGATLLRLRCCWHYLPYFVLSAPLLFLGYCVRCCGELVGYLSS